jgi:diphthine-ammonia ligase
MKVVCLLSGGKDSMLNMAKLIDLGHQVIALATISPTKAEQSQLVESEGYRYSVGETEEVDSFVYQSIGTEMVPVIARALGAQYPLYTLHIPPRTATPLNTAMMYDTAATRESADEVDEVEYLYQLLWRIKQDFPELQAVGSGAIQSNYQRLRFEHVCSRLNLVSLATLWLQDQSRVLEELQLRDFEPRIVKTAAIGLTRAHLGQSVTALSSHLHRLHAQYGVHVCGEGGEYETLVTDCPLYQARIVLDHTSRAVHSDIPYAEVYLLRVHACHLELKSPQVTLAPLRHVHLTADPQQIRTLLQSLAAQQHDYLAAIDTSALVAPRARFRVSGGYFWLTVESTAHVTDVEQETVQLLRCVRDTLTRAGLTMQACVYISAYLRDMKLFLAFNRAYGAFFGNNPPARATVQHGSSTRALIIEVTGITQGSHVGLHVQSISHWAPACIGPYCQAQVTAVNKHVTLIWLAGQIALTPVTMTLDQSLTPVAQLDTCWHHTGAVLTVAHRDHCSASQSRAVWTGGILYLTPSSATPDLMTTLRNNLKEWVGDLAEHVVFVVAPELPRNAAVELKMTACSLPLTSEDDSDDERAEKLQAEQLEMHTVPFEQVTARVTCIHGCYAQIVMSGTVPQSCHNVVPLLTTLHEALSSTLTSAGLLASSALSCTVYCCSAELEGPLQSLLAEYVTDVELSPLLPADCDFVVYLQCVVGTL